VPARWSQDLPSAPARVASARVASAHVASAHVASAHVASAGTLGRQALTGLALAHSYDTAFWWTAGMAIPAIPACASGAPACPAAPVTGRSAAVT
jgi:hypothetical protein